MSTGRAGGTGARAQGLVGEGRTGVRGSRAREAHERAGHKGARGAQAHGEHRRTGAPGRGALGRGESGRWASERWASDTARARRRALGHKQGPPGRAAGACGARGMGTGRGLGVLLGQQAVHSVHSACFDLVSTQYCS